MANTREGPKRNAVSSAIWPTGPSPNTATVSPGLNLGSARALIPRGQDVGQEHCLFVAHPLWDPEQGAVRRVHTDGLCLRRIEAWPAQGASARLALRRPQSVPRQWADGSHGDPIREMGGPHERAVRAR